MALGTGGGAERSPAAGLGAGFLAMALLWGDGRTAFLAGADGRWVTVLLLGRGRAFLRDVFLVATAPPWIETHPKRARRSLSQRAWGATHFLACELPVAPGPFLDTWSACTR